MEQLVDLVPPGGRPAAPARSVVEPPARKISPRVFAAWLLGAFYAGLLLWVVVSFEPQVLNGAVAYVLANGALALLFVSLFRLSAPWPFYVLMYGVYTVVYLFKGVAQYAFNLNTFLSWVTIKTTISDAAYLEALGMVTVGHLVLGGILVLLSRASHRTLRLPVFRGQVPARKLVLLLGATVLWIVVSSFVMRRFGVAVMGSEGVSLPFKMSAVLFYSRLIVLPLFLLYCVERALAFGDTRLLRWALVVFTLLAASEVVVRASKSPPLIMVLQLAFLDLYLRATGQRVWAGIRKGNLVLILVAAISLWPISEVYRTMLVDRSVSTDVATAVANQLNREGTSFVLYAAGRFYERLLGFLQAAGLVADGGRHDLGTLFGYGGIAEYYTHYYLGYTQVGHLSSPSLVGTCLIVAGRLLWPLVFAAYVLAMALVWRLNRPFRHMRVPVACFIAFEATNTIMSGVVDESFERLVLVFASAAALEVALRGLERRSFPGEAR